MLKIKKIWKWLRVNILNKSMILPALIAETIFWSPVWVTALLAIVLDNAWYWTVCVGVIAFWAGPFTPATVLQVGLILTVNKIILAIKNKINTKNNNNQNLEGK